MEHPGKSRRWMYRDGRPNRLAAILNRILATAGSIGWGPRGLVTLEVRGRRTGRLVSFPLMMADHEGEQYLVSMLGHRARWVSNVTAAGGHAVLRRRRSEPVRLVEVDPGERAPILRQYLQIAPGARPHIPVDWRAPVSSFEPIVEQYPVFRVVRD